MLTMKLPTICVFSTLVSLADTLATAADWPNWRGANYDGISEETIPAQLPETLPVKWRAQVGIGFSTVSVAGERVLTMGNRKIGEVETDTVWCLDAGTGKVLWEHSYPCALDPRYYEGGPGGTPTIHERSVYTLSKKGHAFRLNLETGKVVWSRDLIKDHRFELPEWSFSGSIVVDGERLLLNVGRGGLALDRETGKTLWMPSTETAGYATVVPYPAGGEKAGMLLFSAKGLIAFNPATGESVSELPWKSSRDVNAADPIVIGKRIIVSSASGAAMIEPKADGSGVEMIWEQKDMKWYFNPGVLLGDYLYSLHGTTHKPTELMCADARTGEIKWTVPGFGSGGVMAARNTVIVFDNETLTLFDADPTGYKPRHSQKILEGKCWTSPVLANGRLYCRNAVGDLACVEVVAAAVETASAQ
jgi:outer membrane protein assembly factor BamB